MNGCSGHQFQHSIGHGQASTQNRNDRHILSHFGARELQIHGSSDGFCGGGQISTGFVAQVEGNLPQHAAEITRRGLRITKARHFVGNKWVGSDVNWHFL